MSEGDKKIIYTCDEHMEIAIDDYLDCTEMAPEINRISDKKCDYCNNPAEYEVK